MEKNIPRELAFLTSGFRLSRYALSLTRIVRPMEQTDMVNSIVDLIISFFASWIITGVWCSIGYDPNGPLIAPAFQGLACTVWATPHYVVAAIVMRLLHWPPWSQLVITAASYMTLYIAAFYFAGPEFSDLKTLGEACHAGFRFWTYSLALGIPCCCCAYARTLMKKHRSNKMPEDTACKLADPQQ